MLTSDVRSLNLQHLAAVTLFWYVTSNIFLVPTAAKPNAARTLNLAEFQGTYLPGSIVNLPVYDYSVYQVNYDAVTTNTDWSLSTPGFSFTLPGGWSRVMVTSITPESSLPNYVIDVATETLVKPSFISGQDANVGLIAYYAAPPPRNNVDLQVSVTWTYPRANFATFSATIQRWHNTNQASYWTPLQ